jgi:hypothetical protein
MRLNNAPSRELLRGAPDLTSNQNKREWFSNACGKGAKKDKEVHYGD